LLSTLIPVVVALTAILLLWYLAERASRRTRAMPAGLDESITLPHEEEFELYHNALSLCSKKCRVCLDELGIKYKSHHIDLIETGSYENISRHFLKINPGATVPVLLHNGHPVYESHEQIRYAAVQARTGVKLIPDDPEKAKEMQQWIDNSSIVGDDPIARMAESAGNCIPGLTLPLFSAMLEEIAVYKIVEGLLFHRLKIRPLLFLAMKFRGLAGVKSGPPNRIIHKSQIQLYSFFNQLESQLANSGGPNILGSFFSLADVSWMVIFHRLREADWLKILLTEKYPLINKYWRELQTRDSYQSGILDYSHPSVEKGTARIQTMKDSDPDFTQAISAIGASH